ncbi:MAG TPA: heparinase II/III family protein [Bacteroidales bacterium]|nr:heparinase II/III family protein [Bacteroidales bacterium]HQM69104.1 heparinase II/III family protein [Bacteroidales bacterium]
MKVNNICLTTIAVILFAGSPCILPASEVNSRADQDTQPKKLENPVTVQYLKSTLRKNTPRLVLTPAIEKNLRSKLKTDPVVKNYYANMKVSAKDILTRPALTRNVIGRRLLGTSREMLSRMTILSMVYRIDREPAVLKKINEELLAVCNFTDWNPYHFLDVAEMSMAVAFAVDWVGNWLPKSTLELAKTSLIRKGLEPSFVKGNFGWVNGGNNWNQVCNGGMIAAAIAIAEKDPELAAKTISRSLDGMPGALRQYAPSGVYPEGATYWDYGTSFSVTTSSILQSAFGTDFGLAAYPAFLESANFKMLSEAPSGYYFNFADCGDRAGSNGDIILAWFAMKTGNPLYLEKENFLRPVEGTPRLSRLAGPGLVWLSQFTEKTGSTLPLNWFGDGSNPLVVFRGGEKDPKNYYFGGKGGQGTLSHGNLDAGSFVFELNGVRWAIDPGNQDYNTLEQAGFNLWSSCQECERWTLLTKGNQGHSTLTVDDARFPVSARAPITDFKAGPVPEATVDMTPIFRGRLQSAKRKFIKDSDHSIVIEDQIVLEDSTKSITWAVMTTAEVTPTPDGAVLQQDGKELLLKISSPAGVRISTLMMDPPPLKLDKRIPNLKRIEIRMPAYIFTEGKGTVRVRLTAPE